MTSIFNHQLWKKILARLVSVNLILCIVNCSMIFTSPKSSSETLNKVLDKTSICQQACNNLQNLQGRDGNPVCEEGRDLYLDSTIGNLTCNDICLQKSDLQEDFDPKCWIDLTNCNDFNKKCSTKIDILFKPAEKKN